MEYEEYYTGNVLKNHVDRINTHAISVILQIGQELGEVGEDWELEVIPWYTGDRNHVLLKPGEMLLYESANLYMAGRSRLRGKCLRMAFLHYRPVEGWSNYRQSDLGFAMAPRKKNFSHLQSNLTACKASKRMLYSYQKHEIKTEL